MKRFTLFFLVILIWYPIALKAQLTKGTWYVSGATSNQLPVAQGLSELFYFKEAGLYDDQFGMGVSPEFGFFFSRRLLVGSRLSLTLVGRNEAFGVTGIAIAPFVRYYLNPQSDNNHFFANAQLNLFPPEYNTLIGSNLGLGMTHFLAPSIGLDAYLALVEPNFEISRNTQLGLFTSLNVYLNSEMKSSRKTAAPDLLRGTWLIGGTSANTQFGITSARPGASNINGLNIAPNLLYFVTDRLGVGAALNLGLSGNANFSSTVFGISPRLRYYLSPAQHRMFFLAGAYHYDAFQSKLGEQKFEGNNSRASMALGMNNFLTSHLALELSPNLNYQFESKAMRLGVDFGVQFFLGKKPK
jgi:hypothetical protein